MQNGGYRTKQRDFIIALLKENPGTHFTADEILEKAAASGSAAAKATVYRTLEKLVGAGVILKYSLPDGAKACFQYPESECGAKDCYHFLCVDCGEVSHVEDSYIDGLYERVKTGYNFFLDTAKTVFYGKCGRCAAKKAGNDG